MEYKFYVYLNSEIGDDYSGTRLRRLAQDLADIVDKEQIKAIGMITVEAMKSLKERNRYLEKENVELTQVIDIAEDMINTLANNIKNTDKTKSLEIDGFKKQIDHLFETKAEVHEDLKLCRKENAELKAKLKQGTLNRESLSEIFVDNDRLVRDFDKAINILKKKRRRSDV